MNDQSAIGEAVGSAVFSVMTNVIKSVEIRDFYTHGHCTRVAGYVEKLAKDPFLELEDEKVGSLKIAAFLHDFGKVWIDDINLKGGVLYTKESSELENFFKMHPERCAATLNDALEHIELQKYSLPFICILFHHWNYNSLLTGEGYPSIENIENGNVKNCISEIIDKHGNFLTIKNNGQVDRNIYRLGIGLLRVADSIDASTITRPHRSPTCYRKSMESIIEEIENESGKKYHPDIVKVLINKKQEFIKKDFTDIYNEPCRILKSLLERKT